MWFFVKYGSDNFTFFILEICDKDISKKDFAIRENYWYEKFKPSYNLQDIVLPFTGSNHYRFGKKLDLNTRLKISNKLKGRILSDTTISNLVAGAIKKKVYCYDFETGKYLMEFQGLRLMGRILNISHKVLEYKIKKKVALIATRAGGEGITYKLLLQYDKN